MFKKAMILAVAAAALAALAIPATASAQWTKNHQAIQADETIQITGQASFEGEIGEVECQVDADADLLAGQTTVTVTSFGVDLTDPIATPTNRCRVDSTLEFLGCTDVAQVTVDIGSGNHWTGHALSTQTISVTTKTIQNHLHGGIFCPKTIQLTPGTVHLQATQANTWTSGTLSGHLKAHPNDQTVVVRGHGNLLQPHTYGVDAGH